MYAEEHRKYLQSEHPSLLRQYEKSGDLDEYLQGEGEDAAAREEHLRSQSLKETKDLPFLDQMRALANRREVAQELIRNRPDLSASPVVRGRREAEERIAERSRSNYPITPEDETVANECTGPLGLARPRRLPTSTSRKKFEMYEVPDTDTAAVLTTGAIGKLAAAAAELRANNGNILAKLANYETQFDATLADLGKRIDAQAAKVRELIADAERREQRRRP